MIKFEHTHNSRGVADCKLGEVSIEVGTEQMERKLDETKRKKKNYKTINFGRKMTERARGEMQMNGKNLRPMSGEYQVGESEEQRSDRSRACKSLQNAPK